MLRTTIRIEQMGIENPRVLFRIYDPQDVPQANIFQELDCNVTVPPFSDLAGQQPVAGPQGGLVRNVGLAVYERLAVHPGVKAALERVANAAPHEFCPIYLQITTEAAEPLPFETLFLPNRQFLALENHTPIVRVAILREPAGRAIERLCTLPLRVTAVISAAARHMYEEEEWRSLYQAFRGAPLEFQLQVLVGRSELYDLVQQTQDPRVMVQRIDHDVEALVRSIGEFEPSVLHLFCHGTTKPAGYLEVASRATHDLGEEPLYLSHSEIRRVARSLLLVTLNACEGAAPVQDAYSLALAVAEKAEVPAVVGMREAIDAQDANIFTGAFYEAFLDELLRVLSAPPGEVPNWPEMMRLPRRRLMQRQGGPPMAAAEAHKRWSLPVLYIRPEELFLRLIRRDPDQSQQEWRREIFGEIQAYRHLRNRFSKNTPQPMLDEIDKRIATLEQELVG